MEKQDDGIIFRDGKRVVVEVSQAPHLVDWASSGVECLNPGAEDPMEWKFRKVFGDKVVYLPGEYDLAYREKLSGHDVFVIGATGYSFLPEEKCRAYGVKHGAYEAACARFLLEAHRSLESEFSGIDVRFAHGASSCGVDEVIIKVASRLNRPQLGFSCPRYMPMVKDDDGIPVYVAATVADYSDAFTTAVDLLFALNGRKQAFRMDILAVLDKMKPVIPVNIIRSISTTGGPPAVGPDGQIEDAVALFLLKVRTLEQEMTYKSSDPFKEILARISAVVPMMAREVLSVERAFGTI